MHTVRGTDLSLLHPSFGSPLSAVVMGRQADGQTDIHNKGILGPVVLNTFKSNIFTARYSFPFISRMTCISLPLSYYLSLSVSLSNTHIHTHSLYLIPFLSPPFLFLSSFLYSSHPISFSLFISHNLYLFLSSYFFFSLYFSHPISHILSSPSFLHFIRVPSLPVAELVGHQAALNGIAWAPHSPSHICTISDDRHVRTDYIVILI